MLVSSLLVNLSARQLVYLFTRQLKKYEQRLEREGLHRRSG